jgi:hypothetical protein
VFFLFEGHAGILVLLMFRIFLELNVKFVLFVFEYEQFFKDLWIGNEVKLFWF